MQTEPSSAEVIESPEAPEWTPEAQAQMEADVAAFEAAPVAVEPEPAPPNPVAPSHVLVSSAALACVLTATSDDKARLQLNGVLIRADGSLCATDGHRLIECPPASNYNAADYPVPPGDSGRFHAPAGNVARYEGTIIPREAVADAVKAAGKLKRGARHIPLLGAVRVAVNEASGELSSTDLDTTSRAEFRTIEGPYPNVAQVWPKDAPEFSIGFNAAMLAEMLAAFAKVNGSKAADVRLKFYGPLNAVVLENLDGSASGLIMPLRLPENEKK